MKGEERNTETPSADKSAGHRRRPAVELAAEASGAYQAAIEGKVVVVVDLIDMSTTLEAARQQGAALVLGASPLPVKVPASVKVDPVAVGRAAAQAALRRGCPVAVIAEPRYPGRKADEERIRRAGGVLAGLRREGIDQMTIYPNLGAEIVKMADLAGQVVVAVTDCGGAAFDAAWNAGVPVFTATVARTYGHTGQDNAREGLERALARAVVEKRDLAIVAASGKALEDRLAARYLAELAGQLL